MLHMSRYLWKAEETVKSPAVGVAGSCELHDVGSGTLELWESRKNSMVPLSL